MNRSLLPMRHRRACDAGAARRRGVGVFRSLPAVALLLVASAGTPAAFAGETPAAGASLPAAAHQTGQRPAGFWKDVEGNPLPFQGDAEIIDFMRTAEIESVETIPVGITRPRRVVLTKDGVRMRAAMRDFDQVFEDTRISGRFYWRIRDSYLFDIAAYEVAQMLELDNIPPVVLRRVGGVDASLQIWAEGTRMESDRLAEGIEPPEDVAERFYLAYQTVLIFDTLIGNVDRSAFNLLVDAQWNHWLIDHSRSFLASDTVLPYLDKIVACERGLYERLNDLERDPLVERLVPPLAGSDVDWMLGRRDAIVARLQRLISERGVDAVLFDASGRAP